MAIIYTSKGVPFEVSDSDKEMVSKYTWRLIVKKYLATRIEGKSVYLHRLLMNPPQGMWVDHIDGNTFNNKRENLRVCTPSQNGMNRGAQANNSHGYKGITQDKRDGIWCANIRSHGKDKYLGRFKTAELAYEFRCLAAEMLHGEFVNHG
jgi:hypothetical protein